jgi:hypothetical protein
MRFVRTALIVAALILGWAALKVESSAHGTIPAPSAPAAPAH